MTTIEYESLRSQFRKVFAAKWGRSELENYDELQEKFAFHMADIAGNLTALAQAYTSPTPCDTQCLADRTELFFVDCVPHLMAAAQIYDSIPEVFEEQKGVHNWDDVVDDEVVG